MTRALSHPLAALAFVFAACWDAWRWYFARVSATPEEALAMVLTVALVLAIGLQKKTPSSRPRRRPLAPTRAGTQHNERAKHTILCVLRTLLTLGPACAAEAASARRRPGSRRRWRGASSAGMTEIPLLPLAALLTLYAAAQAFAPAIISAAIAVIAFMYALYRTLTGLRPPLAFYGLVALSLPVLPSLQFVLGYPMRIISASITVALLQIQGLAITREGTHMLWRGETIQFDAPCSGINMLWAGLMLTLAACVVWRAGWRMTALAVTASLLLTLAANVLRAVSLFYVEAGLITGAAPWWHEAIGLAAFVIAAMGTLALLIRLRDMEASWVR